MDDASNDTTQRRLRLQLLLKLFLLFYLIVYIALDIALIIIGFSISRKCDDQQTKGFPFKFWIILTGIADICILITISITYTITEIYGYSCNDRPGVCFWNLYSLSLCATCIWILIGIVSAESYYVNNSTNSCQAHITMPLVILWLIFASINTLIGCSAWWKRCCNFCQK
eukprot:362749_1